VRGTSVAVQFGYVAAKILGCKRGYREGGPCHVANSKWIRGIQVWGLLVMLFSALLALPLFHPSVATAQEVKQIKLTEKHMQGFIAVSEHVGQLYDGANPDRSDPKLEAQAEALVKKNGFASLAEYDDVSVNIAMIISGIDQQTKKFPSPAIKGAVNTRE
jgi:hypothetical protein